MGRIDRKYICKTNPKSREDAIIKGDTYRFTVLCDRLIRIEYNKDGIFEDRATQAVINRDFCVPEFAVSHTEDSLKITTGRIEITYHGGAFTKNSLYARFVGKSGNTKYDWHYGQNDRNLKGTTRTLDNVNGECELENGLMSKHCMTVLDDSDSLILADDGWVDVRDNKGVDIYLFGYRDDYKAALKAYAHLTGETPMLSRYALGNWWSRYYKYSDETYRALVDRFKREKLPFSVAVLDMDWHYTKIDPGYGSGWTGFSWNKELFPDPAAFLKFLSGNDMTVTLNLHPAEGVAPHEDCYGALAEAMGVEDGKTVQFDFADPKFVENYFGKILKPLEEEGVSFWWMDWQQGTTTKIEGLDPLWMLNHYHFTDMQSKNVRPMILSRYAGAGSQRYPVGFSGDTVSTWESLDFQPYFTATASNTGYGWWSHDIGGHMGGYRDDEMITRWVQLGVFSPVMRLHSSNSDFMSKEPWNYNMYSERVMGDFLRLRHKLIPYIYTMNYRAYKESIPIVEPLYYECGAAEAYTENRNQYFFGSELLVAPITAKADAVTVMGSTKAYLPEGLWFDFFCGRRYKGGKTVKLYRRLESMPVLAKAGAIIPTDGGEVRNSTDNPKELLVHIFPGADGVFTLYEDDGISADYKSGVCVKTKMELKYGSTVRFTVGRPEGSEALKIADRSFTLAFRCIENPGKIYVSEDGKKKAFTSRYENNTLFIGLDNVNGETAVEIESQMSANSVEKDVFDILLRAQCENSSKRMIYNKLKWSESVADFISGLITLDIDKNLFNAVAETVTADAGN